LDKEGQAFFRVEKIKYEKLEEKTVLYHDDFDQELKAQLNTQFKEEQEERKPSYLLKAATFLILIIFFFFLSNRVMQVFSLPTLPLLWESHRLQQDHRLQKLNEAIVEVRTVQEEDATTSLLQQGSGFNISPRGVVVTNRHVVQDADIVEIVFSEKRVFLAEQWVFSDIIDLAVIFLQAENLPFVELAEGKDFEPAEPVFIIGNPLGLARTAARGHIVDLVLLPEQEALFLEVAAPIFPGSSGSPVFNEDGKVIAIVFASVEDEKSARRGLALPVQLLQAFLNNKELVK
jgi:S1-C subfamily serine protease